MCARVKHLIGTTCQIFFLKKGGKVGAQGRVVQRLLDVNKQINVNELQMGPDQEGNLKSILKEKP